MSATRHASVQSTGKLLLSACIEMAPGRLLRTAEHPQGRVTFGPSSQEGNTMTIGRPRGMQLPDTSHLAPEDAELLEALYIERNAVSRGEAARVRWDVQVAREAVA